MRQTITLNGNMIFDSITMLALSRAHEAMNPSLNWWGSLSHPARLDPPIFIIDQE